VGSLPYTTLLDDEPLLNGPIELDGHQAAMQDSNTQNRTSEFDFRILVWDKMKMISEETREAVKALRKREVGHSYTSSDDSCSKVSFLLYQSALSFSVATTVG
jgi:hypothetical protein